MLYVFAKRLALFAFTIALAIMLSTGSRSATAADTRTGAVKNIVLVHGAWADGSSWAKVIPLLKAKGYTVTAVQIPLTSLHDDVAATKRVLDAQKGPVLLVGHSWGGMVITQAGIDSKVAGLVYVNAFSPDVGQSATDLGKGYPPPPGIAQLIPVDGFLWLPAASIGKFFAQDLPSSETDVMASTQKPIIGSSFTEKVTAAAWKSKPSWCIVGRHDLMIDPDLERAMAKRIHAKVLEVDAGHASMLSKPEEEASFIASAAASL